MSEKMNTTTTNQPIRKNPPPTNRGEEDLNDNVQDGIPGGKYQSEWLSRNKDTPNAKASTYPKPAQLLLSHTMIIRYYAGSASICLLDLIRPGRTTRRRGEIESQ